MTTYTNHLWQVHNLFQILTTSLQVVTTTYRYLSDKYLSNKWGYSHSLHSNAPVSVSIHPSMLLLSNTLKERPKSLKKNFYPFSRSRL